MQLPSSRGSSSERGFNLLFEGDFELIIFEFIVGVFDAGRKGTSMTHIYLLSLSLFHISLHLPFSLASNTTTWQCKVRADEPWVVRLGRIDRLGHGGIGIVYQGLVLAHESRTPISEVRSEAWVKGGHLNE